jgi:hypothetical protein
MLMSQNKKLPDQFYAIPKEVRETATLIFSGAYTEGRSPCVFLPDGSRRWYLMAGFQIKDVYQGKMGSNYIAINKAMLANAGSVPERLERERRYLVLLRPHKESQRRIETGEGNHSYFNALSGEEIITIVELK